MKEKRQQVGEEHIRDRGWFEKGGQRWLIELGGFLVFLTVGLISCLHFTEFHRYFTEC